MPFIRKNLRNFSGFLLILTLAFVSQSPAFAADKLVVISPHRKSIQNEYIPAFKEWYKKTYGTDVEVDWLDQGGTNDDLRFIRSKFAANPKTADIDVFFGGGITAHNEIVDAKLAEKLQLPGTLTQQLPKTMAGISLVQKDGYYMSQAASSFGIFYNKQLLKLEKLPEPKTWSDLGATQFKDRVVLTDPRKSGTSSVMNHIILQSEGWQKGAELLFRMAGNARQFTQSSSDPIKAITAGDASVTPAIDFYALAKIGDIGPDKLGFILPEGKTVIEGDPILILKGAPHRKVADRFVEYTLSVAGQKLLLLPKGAPQGPKLETLGRLAVNMQAYKETEGQRVNPLDPFKAKGFMTYDSEKIAKVRKVFDDMLGATMVDTHKELRTAWTRVLAKGATPDLIAAFAKLPIEQADLETLALKWENGVFRNEQINQWTKFSKEKFESVAK